MNNQDFTSGSIIKKLLIFMVPILGALILQAMYSAVDLLIVGWFGSTAGISAVSTGSNVVNLVTFTITGLTMGITVLISRYIGEGQSQRIGKVLGGVIAFFIVLSIIIAIIMLLFAPQLTTLMQAPAEALELTILYVRICGGGILFVIAYNVLSAVFRGLGDSTSPLLFVAIACVVNIVGDLVLVAGLHLNVVGAAIATITAQAVSVILSLIIISKRELPFTMSINDIGFNQEVSRFLKLGSPIALQELLTNLSFLALCAFINRLGLDASSGYGIAQKVTSFILLVPSSLMQSMSSFVAQNVGAKQEKRALKALLTGMGIGLVAGCFIFTAVMLQADLFASIFTNDEAVIKCAGEYLRGFAPETILTSISFSLIGYYNGHEKTMFVMIQGLAQSFIVRLPVSYIMSIQPNASLTMIGLAAPLATAFGIVILVAYFIKNKNSILANEKEPS
ncbi:MAG: MATE family efflux transporter [Erysipelotrichaceae bacterium]|nr:MATE family efflux transporter [Erysipelotrichaceae bacterium]